MRCQASVRDEEFDYSVILDEEGDEKASWRDEGEPQDVEDRVYEEWQDKKDLAEKKQESSFKGRS